ncbi:hypothetical protein A4R27_18750 [Priestia endophytica]|nr:hypothetical protein A4R27_18750 [Priestia endophytica]
MIFFLTFKALLSFLDFCVMMSQHVLDGGDLDNKISGRCDDCHLSYFKSSVKGGIFLRKCQEEEYLSMDDYIVKREGFYPSLFLI